jgi:tetratricopeptide (TPR) repeat protein
LNRLGELLQQQGKLEEAQEAFERAIEISGALNDQSQLVINLNRLGGLLQQQGKLEEAQKAFERQIQISEALNDLSFYYALALHNLGVIWKWKGDFKEAERLLKKSLKIFTDANDLHGLAKVMNTLGNVLEKQQKWSAAEKVLRQSYDLAYELGDKRGQAITANSLGQVIARQDREENFKLSQMFFRESIKLGEEINDQHHLAKVYTAMGQTLLACGDFESAVESLSKGFEIDISLPNIRGIRIVTPTLAYALMKLSKPDRALEYCDRALQSAPNYAEFLQLREKIQQVIVTENPQILIKTGTVLYIRYNEKDKLRWGRIKPNDGSSVVTFNEKFIGSKTISKLNKGALVEVEFTERYGEFYASKIRVVEDEEPVINV